MPVLPSYRKLGFYIRTTLLFNGLKSIQMFEKCDSSNSKNERLLLTAGFTAKFELVFLLTLENAFSFLCENQ